jgi:hypothetical protein
VTIRRQSFKAGEQVLDPVPLLVDHGITPRQLLSSAACWDVQAARR